MSEEGKPQIPVHLYKHTSQNNGPGNRINHIIALHNKRMVVIGGIPTLSINNNEENNKVHFYNFETKSWGKKEYKPTNAGPNTTPSANNKDNKDNDEDDKNGSKCKWSRSYQASCMIDEKLFIFGGSNHKN